MNKITIGIIIDTALTIPPVTGVTNRLYYLSQELSKLGVTVKIFVCNRNIYNNKSLKILYDKTNIEYHIIPEMAFYDVSKLGSIITKSKIKILQFEDCDTLIRCHQIAGALRIPVFLELHDIESTLRKYFKEAPTIIRSTKKTIRAACVLADHITTMTSLDYRDLVRIYPSARHKLSLIPNPIQIKKKTLIKKIGSKFSVLFLGNMYYPPNTQAAKLIIKKILPSLKDIRNLRIYFIGMAPQTIRRLEKKDKCLVFTGPVNNLNTYFKKIDLALCPVFSGSGMKVKILDYCAAGLPVITTKIGSSGYEKIKSLIVEDKIDEYAQHILRLYKDQRTMRYIGKKNYEAIRQFDIRIIGKKILNIYQLLVRASTKRRPKQIKIKPTKLLWLDEERCARINNNIYYIVRNGKIIKKENIA